MPPLLGTFTLPGGLRTPDRVISRLLRTVVLDEAGGKRLDAYMARHLPPAARVLEAGEVGLPRVAVVEAICGWAMDIARQLMSNVHRAWILMDDAERRKEAEDDAACIWPSAFFGFLSLSDGAFVVEKDFDKAFAALRTDYLDDVVARLRGVLIAGPASLLPDVVTADGMRRVLDLVVLCLATCGPSGLSADDEWLPFDQLADDDKRFLRIFRVFCRCDGLREHLLGLGDSGALSEHDKKLWEAAKAGDASAVDAALGAGANVRWGNPGNIGSTALHEAAYAGHADLVSLLLEKGADPTAETSGGSTPLHSAADCGSIAAASALLRGGADPTATNHGGKTPLDWAKKAGDKAKELAELLDDSAAVEALQKEGAQAKAALEAAGNHRTQRQTLYDMMVPDGSSSWRLPVALIGSLLASLIEDGALSRAALPNVVGGTLGTLRALLLAALDTAAHVTAPARLLELSPELRSKHVDALAVAFDESRWRAAAFDDDDRGDVGGPGCISISALVDAFEDDESASRGTGPLVALFEGLFSACRELDKTGDADANKAAEEGSDHQDDDDDDDEEGAAEKVAAPPAAESVEQGATSLARRLYSSAKKAAWGALRRGASASGVVAVSRERFVQLLSPRLQAGLGDALSAGLEMLVEHAHDGAPFSSDDWLRAVREQASGWRKGPGLRSKTAEDEPVEAAQPYGDSMWLLAALRLAAQLKADLEKALVSDEAKRDELCSMVYDFVAAPGGAGLTLGDVDRLENIFKARAKVRGARLAHGASQQTMHPSLPPRSHSVHACRAHLSLVSTVGGYPDANGRPPTQRNATQCTDHRF